MCSEQNNNELYQKSHKSVQTYSGLLFWPTLYNKQYNNKDRKDEKTYTDIILESSKRS